MCRLPSLEEQSDGNGWRVIIYITRLLDFEIHFLNKKISKKVVVIALVRVAGRDMVANKNCD